MHCLEVIKARNDHAAGREAGHAFNDGDDKKMLATVGQRTNAAFRRGYFDGKQEG